VWGDFLVRFHFQNVNPSALKVKPVIFGLVAKLDSKLTLVKIALMLFCYMGTDDTYEVVGQIIYANGIDVPKIDKIIPQLAYTRAVEALLKHCFLGCQPELKNAVVFKALVEMLIVAGRLVYKGEPKETSPEKPLGERADKFAEMESEFWSKVKKAGINCEPHLKETKNGKKVTKGKEAEGCQPKAVAVAGPSLKIGNDGEVEESLAYKLALQGIQIGAQVIVKTKCKKASCRREIDKGETGTVTGVDDTYVKVLFSEGDEQALPKTMLVLYTEEAAAESAKKKARVDNPSPAKVPPIKGLIKWIVTDIPDQSLSIVTQLISLLLHLVQTFGPTPEEVGFATVTSYPVALRDFGEKELKLFPYSTQVVQKVPDAGSWIEIVATVGNEDPQTLYLLAPDWVANPPNPKGKVAKKVSPFWNAAQGDESEPILWLDLVPMTQNFAASMQVTAKGEVVPQSQKKSSSSKTQKKDEEFKNGKGGPKVVFAIPYFTNNVAVERGREVRLIAGNGIQSADAY